MLRKFVKLILTEGKNEKILTTAVVYGLLWLNLDQNKDSHLVNDDRIRTFLRQFCKLQQKHAIMNELWVKL